MLNKLASGAFTAYIFCGMAVGNAQAFSLSLSAPLGGQGTQLVENFAPAPGRPLKGTATITPAEAAERAVKKRGGKVLSVSLQGNGAAPYYKVKLIRQGTVEVVSIPAKK